MPRSSALATTTFFGKSLEEIHAEIVVFLTEAPTAPRIEDAMTRLGYDDPFAREVIKRTFMPTLKAGGANFALTEQGKWQKGREKWAPESVPSGKVILTYVKTTVPTSELASKLETLNGELPDDTRAAASRAITTLTLKANAKLDRHSIAYVAEDFGIILSESAHLNSQIALHEKYRAQNEAQMQMMQKLVNKLTGAGSNRGSDSVAKQ